VTIQTNHIYSTLSGNQQEECDREGEYANIRHYWLGAVIDEKDDGAIMVRYLNQKS